MKPIDVYTISQCLEYLETLISRRMEAHFLEKEMDWKELPKLKFKKKLSPFAEFCHSRKMKRPELITLLLSLVPHIQPAFLTTVIRNNLPKSGDFPELGGIKDSKGRLFLPTGETALFLIAGTDLEVRLENYRLFTTDHWFHSEEILHLGDVKRGEPLSAGQLILDSEYVELFTLGQRTLPKLSTSFPAQHIQTELEWKDLILNSRTYGQIQDIEVWIRHKDTLMNEWGMSKRLKPGYRALFHGPPGTGKTLTATLLGKYTGKEVFRIDLSMIVSKYIGETEKNLASLFAKAEHKDWILFFDEADSLFGKRTNVRDAHDKYANQEVSYLLQRIESYPGLVILASNFKSNIDDAFMRRFQSTVFFPVPKAAERLQIWYKAFPKNISFDEAVDLEDVAVKYEMTGSNIMNVVQFACLQALQGERLIILLEDILIGIKREFSKEGKMH